MLVNTDREYCSRSAIKLKCKGTGKIFGHSCRSIPTKLTETYPLICLKVDDGSKSAEFALSNDVKLVEGGHLSYPKMGNYAQVSTCPLLDYENSIKDNRCKSKTKFRAGSRASGLIRMPNRRFRGRIPDRLTAQ